MSDRPVQIDKPSGFLRVSEQDHALGRRRAFHLSWIIGTRSGLADPKYWAIGSAFVAIYIALNLLTRWYQYRGLGITLWSPDDGLALLLLIESAAYAPFVLIGGVLADALIYREPYGLAVSVGAEAMQTLGYLAVAAALRRLDFDPRRIRLSNVITLLAGSLAGATLTSLVYCGALYLGGALPADQLVSAARHFWIGDAVGMIVIIPAATAAFSIWSAPTRRWSAYDSVTWATFGLGSCLAFTVFVAVGGGNELFYLLFLPVIWVGMRAGYGGAAIALLATQTALFVTASYIGYEPDMVIEYQMVMLVLSITGLLLGAVVTERTWQSRQLREHQAEMARMSAYASTGAMGMSLAHEISQPLSTVATYLHAARRMLSSGAADDAAGALGKAESEARRAREVLERIRDFVSSGALELESFDLADIAARIGKICREDASARGVELSVATSKPIHPVVADRIAIMQVLNNLVANGVDAAAERADSRGLVVVRVERRGDRVVVEVEDNGPGVSSELADSIFDAYQTTKPRGMGLGLPLSRRIVQNHGGRLWWRPVASGGAVFAVELRVDGPNRNAPKAARANHR